MPHADDGFAGVDKREREVFEHGATIIADRKRAVTPGLGIFYVAMVSTAAGFSVRNLPSMAVEGWSLIFWYVLGTLFFLLPLALTAAELASTWPKAGGVYAWVREAFGEPTGFMAVWSIVVQNLPWYPTVLAFVAVSLAYGFEPAWQDNRLFIACVMIGIFWALTLASLAGPVFAAKLTTFGTVLGTIVPAAVLIGAGVAWIVAGKHVALPPFSASQLVPAWDLGRLPFVSSLLLAFTGLEVSGYYALVVRDPQRNYPKAMALALVAISGLSIFATLAIALAIPADKISLSGGVVQTFTVIFSAFGMRWMASVLALLTAVGAVALMSAWLVGPLLSLTEVARNGFLPPVFRALSARQVPAAVMLWQAVLITIISIAFALVPSVNQAYWILTATTTALLGFYYLPIFAAVIKLRYTQPDTPRPFRVPGGMPGVWITGGVGLIATAFAVGISLERPSNVTFVSDAMYVGAMIVLALVWMVPWAVCLAVRKASWRV
ncbi:MAG: APC family permease [Candidatus Eremiobacteraeota bacterium]|nr:APC family permease [Candidatus Eremiobacteraeota bacterium]